MRKETAEAFTVGCEQAERYHCFRDATSGAYGKMTGWVG